MAWIALTDFLIDLLTSLRFWIGLTIALSVVPAVWSWVQQQERQTAQTIVVGGAPSGGVNLGPILEIMMMVLVLMLPFMLMRWLFR